MFKFLIGIILFLVSIILIIILTPINYFLVWDDDYFTSTALSLDKWGNREFRTLWNLYLILPNGHQFGDIDESISSVLGKNERDGTLKIMGKILVWVLDKLDKNHCENSII